MEEIRSSSFTRIRPPPLSQRPSALPVAPDQAFRSNSAPSVGGAVGFEHRNSTLQPPSVVSDGTIHLAVVTAASDCDSSPSSLESSKLSGCFDFSVDVQMPSSSTFEDLANLMLLRSTDMATVRSFLILYRLYATPEELFTLLEARYIGFILDSLLRSRSRRLFRIVFVGVWRSRRCDPQFMARPSVICSIS
jgi:hypothetical protein